MAGDLREPRPAAPQSGAAWQDVLEELERSLRDATRAIIRLRQTLEEDGEPAEPPRVRPAWSPVLSDREPQAAPPARPALEPVRGSDEALTAPSLRRALEPVREKEEPQAAPPVRPALEPVRRSDEPQTAPPAKGAFEPVAPSDLRPPQRPEAPDENLNDSPDEDDGDLALSPEERSARLSAFERVWERIERERTEQGAEQPPEPSKERHGLELLPQQYLITVEDKESRVDLAPLHRALLTLAKQDDIALVTFANGVPVISVRTERELDTEQLKAAVAAATNRGCEVIPQEGGRIFLRLAPIEEER